MSKAIGLSLDNVRNKNGGPFGAVVVKENTIVGTGTNLVTKTNDPTAHAEIVAIKKACKKLSSFELTGCELYTSCEPCPMCMAAIYWARTLTVFYANTREDAASVGFDDVFIYDELRRPVRERVIPTVQLMREKALEALHYWEREIDKIKY